MSARDVLIAMLMTVTVAACGSGKQGDGDAETDGTTDAIPDGTEDADADVLVDPEVDTSGMSPTAFCNDHGWCWENPTPHGNTLNGVWIDGEDHVWMVGEGGTILQHDGSEWWEWRGAEPTETFRAVWCDGTGDVYALSSTRLLRFDGSEWSEILSDYSLNDLWGIGDELWVAGHGSMRRYNGTTWDSWDMTGLGLHEVFGVAGDDVWAGGNEGVLRHWNGTTWEDHDQESTVWIRGIWGSASNDVWFVANGTSDLLHWNGSVIERVDPGYTSGWNDIWGTGADDIWVLGGAGLVVHRSGGFWVDESPETGAVGYLAVHAAPTRGPWIVGQWGASCEREGSGWSCTDAITYEGMLSVRGTSASDVTAIGTRGVVASRDASGWSVGPLDGPYLEGAWMTGDDDAWGYTTHHTDERLVFHQWDGTTWAEVFVDAPRGVMDVWMDAGGEGWAVGRSGLAFHLDGNEWTRHATPATRDLYAVHGISTTDVWAVGEDGEAVHFDGDGWTAHDTGITHNLVAVWGAASNDVWAASSSGEILHFTGTWTSSYIDGAIDINDLWGSGTDDVWAVGYGGHAFNWDGGSWNPTDTTVSDELYAVWGAASDDVWAVGDHGTVVHWTGSSWAEDTSLTEYYPYGVSGTATDDAWIVGRYGGMFHWQGSGWTEVTNALTEQGLHFWEIFASPAGKLWVVDDEEALHSSDDGLHWTRHGFAEHDDPIVNDVWAAGVDDAWAVTDQGMLLHYDGTTFKVHDSRGAARLDALHGTGASQIWAAGDVLLQYDGTGWALVTDLTPVIDETTIASIHGVSSTQVMFLLASGRLLEWNGSDLDEHFSLTGYSNFTDAFWYGPHEMYAVGGSGSILHYNGVSWVLPRSLTSTNLRSIWGTPDGDLFAVGWSGVILANHLD